MSREQQLKDEDGGLEDEERKLTTDEHRGTQAQGILDHPLVAEAFQALEDGAFERWKETTIAQSEEREELHRQYKAMTEFRRFFEETMESGKVAKHYLPQVRERRNRIRETLDMFKRPFAA